MQNHEWNLDLPNPTGAQAAAETVKVDLLANIVIATVFQDTRGTIYTEDIRNVIINNGEYYTHLLNQLNANFKKNR